VYVYSSQQLPRAGHLYVLANDGTTSSSAATISLTVLDNSVPTAFGQSGLTTNESTGWALTLTASDSDGDTVVFVVVTAPGHGSLSAMLNSGAETAICTYTPVSGYHGPDTFSFKVLDGATPARQGL